MRYLCVKNWEEFQQYKDREPKWIKLHRGLLRDYDFGVLSDKQKGQLMLIWLLAAETGNKVPYDAEWIKTQTQMREKPDLEQLVTSGFLFVYESVQDCTEMYKSVPREEKRREEREETRAKEDFVLPDFIPKKEWDDYLTMRKEKKKPPTAGAIRLLIAKLEKFKSDGDDLSEILNNSTMAGWTGLFPLDKKKATFQKPQTERVNVPNLRKDHAAI